EFERSYIREQGELLVSERLQDRVEDLFDPVKAAMNDFSYEIEADLDRLQTGLEPEVDREALPNLRQVLVKSESGARLVELLGSVSHRDEGISFVRIGLTQALAEPETFEDLLDPDG